MNERTSSSVSAVAFLVVAATVLVAGVTPARAMYDPHHGRWLQRDPLGVRPDVPRGRISPAQQYTDGMNLYQYGRSRPIGHVDALGLWGEDMHYHETYVQAREAGMNARCASVVASANRGVDDWTGAALFPQYHFNYQKDRNGVVTDFKPGRDAIADERWRIGEQILRNTSVGLLMCLRVHHGLNRIGQSLHGKQDAWSHSDTHQAATPFDHAPAILCALWGDANGTRIPVCIEARRDNRLNWDNPHRPDDERLYAEDYVAAAYYTRAAVESLMAIPAVRCCCVRE